MSVVGTVTVLEEEPRLDIRVPDMLMQGFKQAVEERFHVQCGLWALPPTVAFPNGECIYSCKDAIEAGHHRADIGIEKSRRGEFLLFLQEFCEANDLTLLPGKLQK
jgi:hypothetical protein